MSRIPKWKVEKAKVKAVFRLQFHATHIPQPGWDKLFVSFIPTDTGKATAKTTKGNVRNGNCKWSDPIYETTRLLLDTRNRKYDEKLYKLVVAMGSSRSSLLGEVTVNLADFADASKPSSVALPLRSCDYGTVLHVTVQLLTSKTGFREFEQQRELNVKGFLTLSGQRSHNPGEAAAASLEMGSKQLDKGNGRVRFKENPLELPLLDEVEEPNEDYEDSAAGIDGSSNTSESLYTEKNEISSIHVTESLKSTISGDMSILVAGQSPLIVNGDIHDLQLSKQGSNGWTHGWSSEYSADNNLITAYEDNNRLRVRLEGAESAFLQLKAEAKSLQSLSDELGAETHRLAEQLVMELASGEKLTREVSILKSECVKFKTELEELKSATAMQSFPGNRQVADAPSIKQDIFSNQYQIKWLQGLLLLEDMIQEIQSKACLAYHGSDFDFINSDLDVLHCILLNLKQETSLEPEGETQLKEMQPKAILQLNHFIHKQDMQRSYVGHHHHHPEAMLHGSFNSHRLKKDIDAVGILEEKMCEILKKLEESNADKDILTKKMNQMECYYEALIQELEGSRHQTVNELEHIRTEHSCCLYTISALQSQIEKLQQDMSDHFIRFARDKHDLESLNKELEKRAIVSENVIKKVRMNYAIAVDRLQKDLEVLSFQVLSMYETNENLTKQTLIDASQVIPHKYPENNPDEQYKSGIAKFQSERMSRKTDCEKFTMVNGFSNQASPGTKCNFDFNWENTDIFSREHPRNIDLWTRDVVNTCTNGLKIENIETSSQLKSIQQDKCCNCCERLLLDTEAELSEMHMLNMHWEVYTEVLKEAIYHVNDGVLDMNEEIVKLAQQLELSTSEKESLMLKLHSAFDVVEKLRKDEANCHSRCDDLMMKNHILEAKIEGSLEENNSLIQKVAKYESKYKSYLEERNEFEDMLKNESLQRSCLQTEIRSTVEDLKALKEEYDNLSSANSELQRTMGHLQTKLGDLCHSMVSFGEGIDVSTVDGPSLKQEMESNNYMAIVLHLEEFQKAVCKKLLQLHHEKKEIEVERDVAYSSLKKTESHILHLKQKFESDLEEYSTKLDLSNALAEKLQLELQDVADMLKFSLEAVEEHKSTNRELSSKLTTLEIELQKCNDKNRDLAQKLLDFDHVKEELESSKSTLMKCMQENRTLMTSIESGQMVSAQLENEVSNLKENLRCTHDNLHSERGLREELEVTVADLTVKVKEKYQLLEFDNVKEELEKSKLSLMDCRQENRALMMSIESGQIASAQLENELRILKENLKCAHDNVYSERGSREELEATVADLMLQLKERDQKVLACDVHKSELIFLRKRVIDLETEMQHCLSNAEECRRKYDDVVSTLKLQVADLEHSFDLSLSADVKFSYLRCQFQLKMEELAIQIKAVKGEYEELLSKHAGVVTSLNDHIATVEQFTEENARLSTALQSVNAELEVIVQEKEGLLSYIEEKSFLLADLEDTKARAAILEADNCRERHRYKDEICQFRNMLVSWEEEVEHLRSSNVELETTVIILKSKLDEQQTHISSLEECELELKRLREQHRELSYKLSEQILKTEDFKNLSIHLRELKYKADAECIQARERRESEGSSVAMQDSLRIAFIKEQCETKLQEMKCQLCSLKKYAEDMLLKLQTALDEVEIGKRREASLAKRNENLSVKISDMEAELQTVVTDRRELVKTCDRMKAELECTILSLDCCKEEKLKLEASEKDCNEERTRLRVELDLVKRLLENMVSSSTDVDMQKSQPGCHITTSIGEILEDENSQSKVRQETSDAVVACSGEGTVTKADEDPLNGIDRMQLLVTSPVVSSIREVEHVLRACDGVSSLPTLQPNSLNLQDALVTRSSIDKEKLLENSRKHIADIKEHFKGQQQLLTGLDLLHKEFERLKNGNLSSIITLEDRHLDSALQDLRSDLSRLDKANEHLGNIFPSLEEFPGSGNAFERVLALELELAEALQAKKIDLHLQSSFLKQRNNDTSVFQSFRDISELLKDVVELKRRNAAVEAELKEMQGRYSQLSLQFAEVEGQRQQLVMSLKSRSPKKS